jgi:hypothetical protein
MIPRSERRESDETKPTYLRSGPFDDPCGGRSGQNDIVQARRAEAGARTNIRALPAWSETPGSVQVRSPGRGGVKIAGARPPRPPPRVKGHLSQPLFFLCGLARHRCAKPQRKKRGNFCVRNPGRRCACPGLPPCRRYATSVWLATLAFWANHRAYNRLASGETRFTLRWHIRVFFR